jgi:hypothetical protein
MLKLYGVTDVRRIIIHAPNGNGKRTTTKRRK